MFQVIIVRQPFDHVAHHRVGLRCAEKIGAGRSARVLVRRADAAVLLKANAVIGREVFWQLPAKEPAKEL